MALDDEFILAKIGELDIPTDRYKQFSLADIIGNLIIGHRKINNPGDYNSKTESFNTEYIIVLEFEGDRFLSVKKEWCHEHEREHWFYYDGKTVRYTDCLFSD